MLFERNQHTSHGVTRYAGQLVELV